MTIDKSSNKKSTKPKTEDRDALGKDDRDLSMFNESKDLFRQTYGAKLLNQVPEHLKNPKLHYVHVPGDKVIDFLNKGYKIDTQFNGHLSQDMIDQANKPGSAPVFSGIGGETQVLMIIPKKWMEEKEAEEQKMRDEEFKLRTSGKAGSVGNSDVRVSDKTQTKDIDIN